MTHDQMIAVIAHHRDGGEVEYKHVDNTDDDYTLDPSPSFDFVTFDYRVKPEPRSLWIIISESDATFTFKTSKAALDFSRNFPTWKISEYKEVLP